MYKLICTSYTETKDSLTLRNNWIEVVLDDEHLEELLEKWKVDTDFTYPSRNSISEILEGRMELGFPIHIRIIKF